MARTLTIQPQTSPLTVTQAVHEFLDRDWSTNTRRNCQSDLDRFEKTFGPRPVACVTPAEIQGHDPRATDGVLRGDQEQKRQSAQG